MEETGTKPETDKVAGGPPDAAGVTAAAVVAATTPEQTTPVVRSRGGRPKGSKNKPKVIMAVAGKLGTQGPIPGEQTIEEYGVKVEIPDDRLAKVGASLGLTINLGDYQSARIGVWCEMPCDKDKTGDTYGQIFSDVSTRLIAEVEKIKQYRNGKVTVDSASGAKPALPSSGGGKPSASEGENTGL